MADTAAFHLIQRLNHELYCWRYNLFPSTSLADSLIDDARLWLAQNSLPRSLSSGLPTDNDLDMEGKCWFRQVDDNGKVCWVEVKPRQLPEFSEEHCKDLGYTHWLPYHALPLPVE